MSLADEAAREPRTRNGMAEADASAGIAGLRSPRPSTASPVWLGYPATAEYGGRRDRAAPRTLDDAECRHINAMQPPFNDMRWRTAPAGPVTVLNRWWTVDGRPRQRRPHRSWPDLIDYQGPDGRSRMV